MRRVQIVATLLTGPLKQQCAGGHGGLLPQRVYDRYSDRRRADCDTRLTQRLTLKGPPMDWPMFRRVERRARRMHEMMQRLNVEAGTLVRFRGGDAYAQARARCLHCGTCDKCL